MQQLILIYVLYVFQDKDPNKHSLIFTLFISLDRLY